MNYAYCFQGGVVEFGARVPRGATMIAFDTNDTRLRDKMTGACRHAKPRVDPPVLLIPGVPGADDERAKGDALFAFKKWIGFADVPTLTPFQRIELLYAFDRLATTKKRRGSQMGGAWRRGIANMREVGLFAEGSFRPTAKGLLSVARHYRGEQDIMVAFYETLVDERVIEKNKIAALALADKERAERRAAQRLAEIDAMRRVFPECANVTDDEMLDRLHAARSI